jgi:hypothetical protein
MATYSSKIIRRASPNADLFVDGPFFCPKFFCLIKKGKQTETMRTEKYRTPDIYRVTCSQLPLPFHVIFGTQMPD